MKDYISIIGGGLAGSEAAYQIAKQGIKVKLYEMKPTVYSPAHSNQNLAEVVCSNSFKSNLHTNACGLLKEELRRLDSLLIRIADEVSVPAGQALAVDREQFSKRVTEELEKIKEIEIIRKEVGNQTVNNVDDILLDEDLKGELESMAEDGIIIIATGPLTSSNLSKEIASLTGEDKLYFYDAAAPIIEKDSINMNIAFWGERYQQEREKEESEEEWKKRIQTQKEASYLNLPMNQEEYEAFCTELVNAEVVTLHEFEKKELFEGCMPIEIMAKRGKDTLRFGPLKPVGFTDPRTGKRPYALVQLRQDNREGNLFNMVGFQTNLKFAEQQRVFSKIPGLENANFAKYGVMHRNTYINSTKLLESTYRFKKKLNIYFAGQITGVEGYVESIASGLVAGINAVNRYRMLIKDNEIKSNKIDNGSENNINYNIINEKAKYTKLETEENFKIIFPEDTMIGALAKYISTSNNNFQPMNANFGILPELPEKIKDKKAKYAKLADKAIESLKTTIKCYNNITK